MPPACSWCGAPAIGLVEVEPSRLSASSTRRKQNRLAVQLPACRGCRARLASQGHKFFPVVDAARREWWERRQGHLF